jgi:hypothetical protein
VATITRGEPRLAELLRPADESVVERLCAGVAIVWDAPSEDTINRSLDGLLARHLPPHEQWLLTIPRVLVPGQVTTDLLVSADGGAAFGMPWAAFGSLFRLNELVVCLDLERNRLASQLAGAPAWRRRAIRRRLDATPDYGAVVNHWFTGRPAPPVLPAGLDVRPYDQFVWRTTVFQQALIVLHGFARVLVHNRRPARPDPAGPERSVPSFSEELGADAGSSAWVLGLARELFPGRPTDAAQALLILFTALDIANDFAGQRIDPHNLSLRAMLGINRLGGGALIPGFAHSFAQVIRDPFAVPDMFRGLRALLGAPRRVVSEARDPTRG